jgi:DNA-binding response OmpR family regulator
VSSLLLVDDEALIADVLARSLRARGHVVRVVHTGMDALLALSEEVPDLMLLDISLPDITGWELLRSLAPRDRERVPVVVFSASPLAPPRLEQFKPAGVLQKPFPIEALLRLVNDLASPIAGKEERRG